MYKFPYVFPKSCYHLHEMARNVITIEAEEDYSYAQETIGRVRVENAGILKQLMDMQAMYEPGHYRYEDKVNNFCAQARFMKDYEDDYVYQGTFDRPFPVYHDMRLDQLRGYFSWRKKVRCGIYERTNAAFAKVYLYELLNGIGAEDASEACDKIEAFYEQYVLVYGESDLAVLMERWLREFTVMHQLDEAHRNRYFQDLIQKDADYAVLLNEQSSISDFMDACVNLGLLTSAESPYSRLSKEEYGTIAASCFRMLVQEAGQEKVLQYLGKKKATISFRLFADAIVQTKNAEDVVYEVDPFRIYRCRKGVWSCETFWNAAQKDKTIKLFFKEMERQIRMVFSLGRPLKETELDEEMRKKIQQCVVQCAKQFRKQKAHVEIDTHSLSSIRIEADLNREKLLIEEEKEELVETPEEKQLPLSKEALYVLQHILDKESYDSYLEENHLLASVLYEEINALFLDVIGDTVLLFEANDQVELVEDYKEDILAWMKGGSDDAE